MSNPPQQLELFWIPLLLLPLFCSFPSFLSALALPPLPPSPPSSLSLHPLPIPSLLLLALAPFALFTLLTTSLAPLTLPLLPLFLVLLSPTFSSHRESSSNSYFHPTSLVTLPLSLCRSLSLTLTFCRLCDASSTEATRESPLYVLPFVFFFCC